MPILEAHIRFPDFGLNQKRGNRIADYTIMSLGVGISRSQDRQSILPRTSCPGQPCLANLYSRMTNWQFTPLALSRLLDKSYISYLLVEAKVFYVTGYGTIAGLLRKYERSASRSSVISHQSTPPRFEGGAPDRCIQRERLHREA